MNHHPLRSGCALCRGAACLPARRRAVDSCLLNDCIGEHFVMQPGAHVNLSGKQRHGNEKRFSGGCVVGAEIGVLALNFDHGIVLWFHMQHPALSQNVFFMIPQPARTGKPHGFYICRSCPCLMIRLKPHARAASGSGEEHRKYRKRIARSQPV